MNILTQHQDMVYEEVITKVQSNLFSLTPSSRIEERMISLVGAAGTGKSFLTSVIVKQVLDNFNRLRYFNENRIVVTAPTHKAVSIIKEMLKNNGISDVNCTTIQSFLKIQNYQDTNTGAEGFAKMFTLENNKAELLIVDESSMVSKQMFNYIKDSITKGDVNTVLFIGDKYQLLPIFETSSMVFDLPLQYELTQVVRQAQDSMILSIASKVREAIETGVKIDLVALFNNLPTNNEVETIYDQQQFIKEFYSNPMWINEDKIILSYTNGSVDFYNNAIRSQYWLEQHVTHPTQLLSGDRIRFQEPVMINNTIIYHNSEEVVLHSVELVIVEELNISYWKCSAIGNDASYFNVLHSSSILQYNQWLDYFSTNANNIQKPLNKQWWEKYFKLKGYFTQIQYIYSSTIHKSQGSTYESASIDLLSILHQKTLTQEEKYRLIYVALTRASKFLKILL
jgi:hypothetical protein